MEWIHQKNAKNDDVDSWNESRNHANNGEFYSSNASYVDPELLKGDHRVDDTLSEKNGNDVSPMNITIMKKILHYWKR